MALTNKLVIHAGGIFPNPLLNREGAAAVSTLPGTIGSFVDDKFTASVDGTESILYVADMDYLLCKNASEAIEAGNVVVGIHPVSGMFLNVRAAAGTYNKGTALKIANGAVATGGSSIFYAEETATITAGGLLRVVVK